MNFNTVVRYRFSSMLLVFGASFTFLHFTIGAFCYFRFARFSLLICHSLNVKSLIIAIIHWGFCFIWEPTSDDQLIQSNFIDTFFICVQFAIFNVIVYHLLFIHSLYVICLDHVLAIPIARFLQIALRLEKSKRISTWNSLQQGKKE